MILVLGYGTDAAVRLVLGAADELGVQRVLVDLRVTYAGARADAARVKVFKLDAGELGPGGARAFRKRLSLKQLSTRTHHPGRHRVEALVNGAAHEVGGFEVTR